MSSIGLIVGSNSGSAAVAGGDSLNLNSFGSLDKAEQAIMDCAHTFDNGFTVNGLKAQFNVTEVRVSRLSAVETNEKNGGYRTVFRGQSIGSKKPKLLTVDGVDLRFIPLPASVNKPAAAPIDTREAGRRAAAPVTRSATLYGSTQAPLPLTLMDRFGADPDNVEFDRQVNMFCEQMQQARCHDLTITVGSGLSERKYIVDLTRSSIVWNRGLIHIYGKLPDGSQDLKSCQTIIAMFKPVTLTPGKEEES